MGSFLFCPRRPQLFPFTPHSDQPPSRRKFGAYLVVRPSSLLCCSDCPGRWARSCGLCPPGCLCAGPGLGVGGIVLRASPRQAPWGGPTVLSGSYATAGCFSAAVVPSETSQKVSGDSLWLGLPLRRMVLAEPHCTVSAVGLGVGLFLHLSEGWSKLLV